MTKQGMHSHSLYFKFQFIVPINWNSDIGLTVGYIAAR